MYRSLRRCQISNDALAEDLILSGFVRQTWSKFKIGISRFPPRYLLKMMQTFVCEEMLDVVTPRRQWSIPLRCLLEQLY